MTALALLSLAIVGAAGGWWVWQRTFVASHTAPRDGREEGEAAVKSAPETAGAAEAIDFPPELWSAASIEIQPVRRGAFAQTVELTGKIALNEDRIAHIFPLVDGRVEQVKIRFGDKVEKGQLLVVVQSKEVGQTMLQLFQNRLQRDFAVIKDRWTQEITSNTQAMIKLIREEADIDEIEKQLTNRPMGQYRDQLMTAYIELYKSRKHLQRLAPLSQSGTVTGKQLLEAETQWNAARATMQSLVEQIQHEAQQTSVMSTQTVKELQTRVAVDETNLKILGFSDEALLNIDPASQGESLAHYPIYAPFDGTIITKDVVLLERVAPERQILSVADLSTVWVATDIYEEHLPLLQQLDHQTIKLHCDAWPNRTFEAQIFYTGDVVDESSRTISMRALADNREGLLKPGMFVNVEFPSLTQTEVLQVPATAIQEHQGASFVFVHAGDGKFQRRDVTVGRRNADSVEIKSGLKPDEQIVTSGGFALKSRMLAELLAE
jgi:cobalt-zinc-cadmium efflux system membrane fusion protein